MFDYLIDLYRLRLNQNQSNIFINLSGRGCGFWGIVSRSALGFRAHLFELLLVEVLLVVDFSLPGLITLVEVFVVLLGLNHVEVDLVLILILVPAHDVDDALHVSHEFEFVLERVRGFL